jgi:hypothetical protein
LEWENKINRGLQFCPVGAIRQSLDPTPKYQFNDGVEDDITWMLSLINQYSTTLAYKAQFSGAISIDMSKMVWKNLTPPKSKFLAKLALQNRPWM